MNKGTALCALSVDCTCRHASVRVVVLRDAGVTNERLCEKRDLMWHTPVEEMLG